MKKKLIVLSSFALGLAPVMALAQQTTIACNAVRGTLGFWVCETGRILSSVIPVVIVLGVIYFIWGVITYAIGTEEEQKKAGREKMIYGIIGLAVIVGVWGLVNILDRTCGVGVGTQVPVLPTIPYQ